MSNFNNYDLLEIVEAFASDNRLIASEQELSDRFDENIAPLVVEKYGEDDEPAMSEGFNDWADAMCTDGEIHPEQYSQYCYVGKYA